MLADGFGLDLQSNNPVNGETLKFSKRKRATTSMGRSEGTVSSRPFLRLIQEIETLNLSIPLKYGDKSISTNSRDLELWVDKHSPEKFTDLLTYDKANVEVLKWVSQWKGPASGHPERKVLLIAGPPGLGKTTLVHVVAKVAGYNMIEINASEERTGEPVIKKIQNAIGSNGIAAKPNLVLLDEIDGTISSQADTNLVNFLVKLCKASTGSSDKAEKSNQGKEDEEEEENEVTEMPEQPTAKPKGKKKNRLVRPIVCVCNNLYHPALKQLRPLAHIVSLKKPSAVMLAKRLRAICELEGLKIDSKCLVELCEMTECDVRSCLHTLQFLSTTAHAISGGPEFTKRIRNSLKDMARTELNVLSRIFRHDPDKGASDTRAMALERLIDEISKDEDRLVDSCHEAFLEAKFFDDCKLTKVNAAYDWLAAADCWKARFPFDTLGYARFVPVKFANLFASPSSVTLSVRSDYELNLKSRASQQILSEYLAGLESGGRTDEIVLSRLPLLLQIIQPRISVPNPQLLKPGEKLHLEHLVRVMATERLTYIESKAPEDGSTCFILDPPVDQLTRFKTVKPSFHDSAIRKLVSHEITQAKIKKQKVPSIAPVVPSKRKEPPVKTAAVKKDFFGRIIAVVEDNDIDSGTVPDPVNTGKAAFYRFNEGFSNAVRRNIKIRDLFPMHS